MQEISTIKQKILQYIEYKGITKYKFYQDTGITRGILDHVGGMSEENMLKFLAYFPEVNPTWLITGRGSMLTDVHASTGVAAGEKVLAERPAPAPAEAIQAHTGAKPPKMGNYASDRLIEEKQRMYEAQIAMLYDKLEEANRKCGRLEAVIEELQAQLDTSASRADSAADAFAPAAEKKTS